MEIIEIDINLLKPAEYNPRAMTDKEAEELEKSLDEFGLVEPIIVNKFKGRENIIIGGHRRYDIYKKKGKQTIPVYYVSLPIEKEKELNLRLNKNTGHWDWSMLVNLEEELLRNVGFTEEELISNFGLNNVETESIDPDRLMILEVYPPEAPKLKEKAQIHFRDLNNYKTVKQAILNKRITEETLIKLLK